MEVTRQWRAFRRELECRRTPRDQREVSDKTFRSAAAFSSGSRRQSRHRSCPDVAIPSLTERGFLPAVASRHLINAFFFHSPTATPIRKTDDVRYPLLFAHMLGSMSVSKCDSPDT